MPSGTVRSVTTVAQPSLLEFRFVAYLMVGCGVPYLNTGIIMCECFCLMLVNGLLKCRLWSQRAGAVLHY